MTGVDLRAYGVLAEGLPFGGTLLCYKGSKNRNAARLGSLRRVWRLTCDGSAAFAFSDALASLSSGGEGCEDGQRAFT